MGSEQSNASSSPSQVAGTKRLLQFSLRDLLLATAIVAFVAALVFSWGPIGLVSSYFVVCIGVMAWAAYGKRDDLCAGAFLIFVGIAVISLLFPAVGSGPASPRMQCGNHLKQIAIALLNYHSVFESFPPAFIADANGNPLHSWRVLILPFCEGKPIFDNYDFNEPWDGPNNSKLATQILPWARCPAHSKKQPPLETNYVAVVGPQTMWPGAKATKLTDLADGTSNTIMVVEVENSGIHWMEPRDLHVTQMPMVINPPSGQGISSAHVKCALVVFADGHTQALLNDIPPETLRALLTINGGEKIGDF